MKVGHHPGMVGHHQTEWWVIVYSGEVDPLIPGQVDPLYQWPVSSSVKELE